MGVVYEARGHAAGRARGAEVPSARRWTKDSQLLERFQREARAASALNHPNICTIYAIEQHDRHHVHRDGVS